MAEKRFTEKETALIQAKTAQNQNAPESGYSMTKARAGVSLSIAFLSLFIPLMAFSQETLGFDMAMESLARSLASSPAAAKPMRIAFLPLAAQGKSAASDSGFGSFAADQLAIRAKAASAKLRVFERSRLSDILAENELSLSGLIDAEQAMRIGGLAPVDALVTGSYAADPSSITLIVRMVSVVTGEILFSGTARSAIDSGAAAFFGPTGPGSGEANGKDRLTAALDEMKRLLSDISTDAKLDKAVSKAIGYPLSGEFCQVHSLVCDTFERYGKKSPRYRSFLIDSMKKIELIDGSGPTYALIDAAGHLANDGGVDDEEFSAILQASSVMTATNYYNVVFQYAIGLSSKARAAAPPAAAVVDARCDAIMSRAKAGTLGRPAAIDPGVCLDELLGALQGEGRAIARAYRLNASLVTGKGLDRTASTLKRAFNDEKDEEVKRELLSLIAANLAAQDFDDTLARDLWSFARGLDGDDHEGAIGPWAAELARLCPQLLSKAILRVSYSQDERILFCLRYGIDAPGLVPPIADIKRDIAYGETIQEKREAAAMLIALGPKAAVAEDSVRQTLKFIQDKSIDGVGSPNLQEECYRILASIPQPKAESLEMLALGLDHGYSDVRKAAGAAIEKIGERALPYLRPRIAQGERAKREDVIRLLARMGKRAKALAPDLEKAAAAEKDEYLKGLMLDALSKIR
jgi:hypothetical protein